MKRLNPFIYRVLGLLCFVVWNIITAQQVKNPHPYRGLIGNVILVIGIILFIVHAKVNNVKSPFYHPDKKKHIRNWIIYFSSIILTVIVVSFFYLKVYLLFF